MNPSAPVTRQVRLAYAASKSRRSSAFAVSSQV